MSGENHGDTPDAPSVVGSLKEVLTDNLFKDARNTVLTLVFGGILTWAVINAFTFVFTNTKTFVGDDGETVTRSGWEVVRDPLQEYFVGPNYVAGGGSLLTVVIGLAVMTFAIGLAVGSGYDPDAPRTPWRRQIGLVGVPAVGAAIVLSLTTTPGPALSVLGAVVAFEAGRRGMRLVPAAQRGRVALLALPLFLLALGLWAGFSLDGTRDWGGLLLLNVGVAAISIIACFPIGVLLALGRRSSFPLIRPFAVGFIELIRGVPLISLLFLGQFALGFLLPEGMEEPANITKATVMITLFMAAYVAEIVRGGLQSVPAGQVEAGQAVGLQPLTITRRIILPQALRNSIPPLIGQFISLLKDTTLLYIISQPEMLRTTTGILSRSQFQFQGFTPEAYAFIAFMFWVICFTMSRASQRLETRLGVGTR